MSILGEIAGGGGADETVGKRGRATLRGVAERAGVSVTTASFVLSGRRDMRISAATEERVLQAARTLDYRRRLVPRATLPASAPAIGLVSDVVATESFAGEMVRGCIAAATEAGHVILVADTRGRRRPGDLGRQRPAGPWRRQVRLRHDGDDIHTVPRVLRDRRVVLVNTVDPTLAAPTVIPDDTRAGRTAAQTLVGRRAHHRHLAGREGPAGGGRRRPAVQRHRGGAGQGGSGLAGRVDCGWWPADTRDALTALFAAGWWARRNGPPR